MNGDHELHPDAVPESDVGRQVAADHENFESAMIGFYRGELNRTTTWRQRMDETTKWAVTIIAALLVYGFSTQGTPEVLLAGVVATMIFLGIESRRYQDYDVYRARVRLLQENLFAEALDPTQGLEHRAWRQKLAEDLRNPAIKTPYREAFARRLRWVYLLSLLTLLAAWLFRIAVFSGDRSWLEAASIGLIPGVAVAAAVAVFYLAVGWIAFRPRRRHAKEEFDRSEDADDWKDDG